MYQQLIVLREGLFQTLDAACSAGGAPVAAAAAPTNVCCSAAGNSELADEVKKLKEENNKLNYRVKFLCRSLDEAESSSKKKWINYLVYLFRKQRIEERGGIVCVYVVYLLVPSLSYANYNSF